MRTPLLSYIRWHEDEEDTRLSDCPPDPSRAVRITSLPCLRCGGGIVEIVRADGSRSFDVQGVVSTPDGVRHWACPAKEHSDGD